MSRQLERLSRAGYKTTRLSSTSGIRSTGERLTQADIAHSLSGLGKEATAWASLAYVNSNDEKSLTMLVSQISKLLLKRYPKMPPQTIVGLVKICFHEALTQEIDPKDGEKTQRKQLTVTAKAKAMGINRASFYKNKAKYDEIVNAVMYVVNRWEDQITENMNRRLSKK